MSEQISGPKGYFHTQGPKGFGGIPRTVDYRDLDIGSYQNDANGEVSPPTFIQDLSKIPVLDQGKYPTCGAYAGCVLDAKLQTDSQKVQKSLSPKYLWDEIKQVDGYPLTDGTDMRSIMKTLGTKGDCDASLLADDFEASLEAYSSISNVTDAMVQNGAQNVVKTPAYANNPTWQQIKDAIYKNKAVLVLVDVSDAWWLPDYQHVNPLKLGNVVGHHFNVLHSYDEKYIYFRNSWGADWGDKGDGYFDISYLPHVLEIGVSIVLPNQFIFTKDMQRGESNNDVVQLQRRLNVLPDSGFFGPLTYAAVKAYQTEKGITPISGYVGVKTRTALNTNA